MRPFTYTRPATLEEALAAGARPGSLYLSGGTTLVDLMRDEVLAPAEVVDLGRLPLDTIRREGRVLRIGALARMSDVAADPLTPPMLAQALRAGASPQIREMARVGGNLLQRTRCPYFREPDFPCNKRVPGSGCPARAGEHRDLAVLGGSDDCVATHPSDLAVALVALDAVVVVRGLARERRVPVEEFYLLPGSTPHLENVLEPGELITAVELAPAPRGHYLKVTDRAAFQFAVVSVAVARDASGIRLALGGVGTRPWRARRAEVILNSGGSAEAAAQAALSGARPLPGNAFKIELAERAIVRALEETA